MSLLGVCLDLMIKNKMRCRTGPQTDGAHRNQCQEPENSPKIKTRAQVSLNAAHKHPKVRAWLARHPRWIFHFTPTSASWLNAVESFFSALTRRRIRRGVFCSIVDLQAAIHRYIAEHNDNPKPFIWTKSAKAILAKTRRVPVSSV